MKLILSIVEGPGGREQFVFDGHDTFIAGRSKKNTHSRLRGDPYISRHHFLLELAPPSCFLKDLGSTNGTVVNGAKLDRGELRELFSGDEIRVGKTVLRLDLVEEEDDEGREGTISLEGDIGVDGGTGTEGISDSCRAVGGSTAGMPGSGSSVKIRDPGALEKSPAVKIEWDNAISGPAEGAYPVEAPGVSPTTAEPVQRLCDTCGKDMGSLSGSDAAAHGIWAGALFLCRDCAERGPSTGRHFGEYEVLSLLGKGGMGEVWKGRHRGTGLLVALKTLIVSGSLRDDSIKLFKREMKVMRRLVHPNIVRFLDQGEEGDEHFIVMELVKGGSVSDLMEKVRRSRLKLREGCSIICQALEGLHHAHQNGFIHRDIKPQNILLHRSGDAWTARISDFGLAKSFREAGGSMMTRDGEVAGTIIFMAPEQLTDYRFVKPPADLYSMGVSLCYMLTGRYHFPCPSPLEEMKAMEEGKPLRSGDSPDPLMMLLCEDPVPVEKIAPDIPAPLAEVMNRAVAKEESLRFTTAGEMRDAILGALKQCSEG